MKVTKIVKEYVEKVVWRKYDEVVAQIPKVVRLKEDKDFKRKVKEYTNFAKERFDILLEELSAKRDELGIQLDNERYKKQLMTSIRFDYFMDTYSSTLKDDAYEEYQQEISKLRAEYRDKIDTILIGLEIGDIKKQELETALEEFKI